jgi:hypothetical protein
MLQTLILDVTDVEFRYCRHVMLGVVSRRERTSDVWCCTQHSRNIVATWSQHRGRREEAR